MILKNAVYHIFVFYVHFVHCWFEDCDKKIHLNSTKTIYITSPNYPLKYPSGSSCRYTVIAPPDNQIEFNCSIDFETYQNTCTTELFYFNSEGAKTEDDSEYFCGNGTLIRKSMFNQATIFYASSSSSSSSVSNNGGSGGGGWFKCLIHAKPPEPHQECDCGWNVIASKIVGGIESAINEFPSMAGIVQIQTNKIFCGATIIHHKYLLSAAHCFIKVGNNDPQKIAILVGEHDTETDSETPFTELYFIEKIILHENFDQRNLKDDIALLRTQIPIQWYQAVGPACLPFNFIENYFIGKKLDVSGWGTTSFGGYQSKKLLKIQLDVINNEECHQNIPILQKYQFCTYTDYKDTCQFDSGGALYWREQRNYAIGIASYGFACATKIPSVNIEILPYLNWIQNKAIDANFCRK